MQWDSESGCGGEKDGLVNGICSLFKGFVRVTERWVFKVESSLCSPALHMSHSVELRLWGVMRLGSKVGSFLLPVK